MKLDRRSFIRLVPLGLAAALAVGSWWFFREAARGPMITSEATVTTSEASQTTTANSETSQATVTTTEGSQATVTTPEALQTTVTTSEASQGTVAASKAFDFPVTWNELPAKVNLHDYRLKVDGDVSNPLDLTLDDLRAMPSIQRTLNINCVLRWAAEVPWEGIPLSHLLSLAEAPAKIAHVTVESVAGYTMTMGSDEAANPDNMIALKAGGVSLTVEHGYPARLVAPTRAGADWVKCVERITCSSK